MKQTQLQTKITELRSRRSVLLAQPPGTPEQNLALDMKMIDLDFEASALEDQLDRDLASAFRG